MKPAATFFSLPPARRLYLVRAWGNLALVLGLIGLSFTFEMDRFGRIFFYGLIGFFLIRSLLNFRQARKTPPDVIAPPDPGI